MKRLQPHQHHMSRQERPAAGGSLRECCGGEAREKGKRIATAPAGPRNDSYRYAFANNQNAGAYLFVIARRRLRRRGNPSPLTPPPASREPPRGGGLLFLFLCLQLLQHPLPGAEPGKDAAAQGAGGQVGGKVDSEGYHHLTPLRAQDHQHHGDAQHQPRQGA